MVLIENLVTYLPEFMAPFKKEAKEWRKSIDIAGEVPFAMTAKAVVSAS